MNKLLLSTFVALAVFMSHVSWTSGFADTFYDDFVAFPSLRAKRELEFEEFLEDGNMKEAKKRAINRQRRMNEENMSEVLKRHRRSLLEEDEEGEHEAIKRCSVDVYNNRKRGLCIKCVVYTEPIKWKIVTEGDEGCGTTTAQRFKEAMAFYTDHTSCKYEAAETTGDPDITIKCMDNMGNYAPLGKSSVYKEVNVEQIYSGKAGKKVISHELGHVCCLDHTQKLKYASAWEEVLTECVQEQYLSQYEVSTCDANYSPTLVNPASLMQYPIDAFSKDGCPANILSVCPSMASTVFAIRKAPYMTEIQLIMDAFGLTDTCTKTGLDDNVVMGKNCEPYVFTDATQSATASVQDSCLVRTTYTVENGNLLSVKCAEGANFMTASTIAWGGIPEGAYTCSSGAGRILVIAEGDFGEYAVVCGDGQDDACTHYLNTKTNLILDGRNMNSASASLSVDVSCCR